MSRPHPWLIVSLFAALALAGIVTLREPFVRTSRLSADGEARVNPLYGLELMLIESGIDATSSPRLRDLPPVDHVLVVVTPNLPIHHSDIPRVAAWMEQGGHLVVSAGRVSDDEPIFQALGINSLAWGGDRSIEDEGADEDLDHQESEEDIAEAWTEEPPMASVYASDRPLWPRLSTAGDRGVLYVDGSAEDGAFSLTLAVGKGAATVLSEPSFLYNSALGDKDHALIAWHAVTFPKRPTHALLVYQNPHASLFTLMTSRARPLAISLGFLLLAALWFQSRRFGPLVEQRGRQRRHLSEHIEAVGRFLWRHKNEEILINAQRDALRERFARSQDPTTFDLVELSVLEAERSGLDVDAVRAALDVPTTRDPRVFVKTIRSLEALRRQT